MFTRTATHKLPFQKYSFAVALKFYARRLAIVLSVGILVFIAATSIAVAAKVIVRQVLYGFSFISLTLILGLMLVITHLAICSLSFSYLTESALKRNISFFVLASLFLAGLFSGNTLFLIPNNFFIHSAEIGSHHEKLELERDSSPRTSFEEIIEGENLLKAETILQSNQNLIDWSPIELWPGKFNAPTHVGIFHGINSRYVSSINQNYEIFAIGDSLFLLDDKFDGNEWSYELEELYHFFDEGELIYLSGIEDLGPYGGNYFGEFSENFTVVNTNDSILDDFSLEGQGVSFSFSPSITNDIARGSIVTQSGDSGIILREDDLQKREDELQELQESDNPTSAPSRISPLTLASIAIAIIIFWGGYKQIKQKKR